MHFQQDFICIFFWCWPLQLTFCMRHNTARPYPGYTMLWRQLSGSWHIFVLQHLLFVVQRRAVMLSKLQTKISGSFFTLYSSSSSSSSSTTTAMLYYCDFHRWLDMQYSINKWKARGNARRQNCLSDWFCNEKNSKEILIVILIGVLCNSYFNKINGDK